MNIFFKFIFFYLIHRITPACVPFRYYVTYGKMYLSVKLGEPIQELLFKVDFHLSLSYTMEKLYSIEKSKSAEVYEGIYDFDLGVDRTSGKLMIEDLRMYSGASFRFLFALLDFSFLAGKGYEYSVIGLNNTNSLFLGNQLIKNKLIDKNVFYIHSEKVEEKGAIYFGDLESENLKGTFRYKGICTSKYFDFSCSISYISINNDEKGLLFSKENARVHFDPERKGIFVNKRVFDHLEKIYKKYDSSCNTIKEYGSYIRLICSDLILDKVKQVNFGIGGFLITLEQDILFYCLENKCTSQVNYDERGGGIFYFGNSIFRQFVIEFNHDEGTVAFHSKKDLWVVVEENSSSSGAKTLFVATTIILLSAASFLFFMIRSIRRKNNKKSYEYVTF